MPFQIIRNDITKVSADVIVNTIDEALYRHGQPTLFSIED